MPGFDSVIRGGLRLKRHSEAFVADERRRKKKKKQKENKEEDTGPTVVELPQELATDPEAVAAAAAIAAGGVPPQDRAAAAAAPPEAAEASAAAAAADSSAAAEPGAEEAEADSNEGKRDKSSEGGKAHSGTDDLEALLAETNPHWTAAERAFFLARKAREAERIKNQLKLTHRQRMEKFNQHLASLSEHFDQPRVGPG